MKTQTFNEFYGKNEAVFKKLSLDKDACVLKMRLLSLCSLAARQESIPYAQIATCLQVQPISLHFCSPLTARTYTHPPTP